MPASAGTFFWSEAFLAKECTIRSTERCLYMPAHMKNSAVYDGSPFFTRHFATFFLVEVGCRRLEMGSGTLCKTGVTSNNALAAPGCVCPDVMHEQSTA